MTVDPNRLLLAAEAIVEDRGFAAAIDQLQTKLHDTKFTAEQERNAILWVIGSLRRRRAERGFYQHQQTRTEDAKA